MSYIYTYRRIICLLALLMALLCCPSTKAVSVAKYEEFLPANMCEVKCGSRVHTLCEKADPPPKCPYKWFEVYNLDKFHTINMKDFLIIGHNGLRDRIATRMNVPNMVKVNWDVKLEKMAMNYARRCTPFEDDACTHLKEPLEFLDAIKYYEGRTSGEKYIAMNRFCELADYLPRDFIELTLRGWYFEKNILKRPTLDTISSMHDVGILKGENNFTHLAYPFTYLLGCSMARYDDYFCIFCNYYPYYPNPNNQMIFSYGEPCSDCPSMFPLRDEFFSGICTGDYFDGVLGLSANTVLLMLLVCLLVLSY